MTRTLAAWAPLAACLTAIGYCIWPYIERPEPGPAPRGQLPRLEAGWLAPSFSPPPPRDPFVARTSGPPAAPAGRVTADGAGTPARGAPRTVATEADARPVLTLGATLVGGPRRSAIINGHVYRQGAVIEAGPGTWKLALVEPRRVILQDTGRRKPLVLEFAALQPRSRPSGPAQASRSSGAEARATPVALAGAPEGGPPEGGAPEGDLPEGGVLETLAERSGGSIARAYELLLHLALDPGSLRDLMRPGAPGRP